MTLDTEDINAISNAIWNRAMDGPYNAAEIMRLMTAILLGGVTGAGSGTETFMDVTRQVPRVIANVDNSGNRTEIQYNTTTTTIDGYVDPDYV